MSGSPRATLPAEIATGGVRVRIDDAPARFTALLTEACAGELSVAAPAARTTPLVRLTVQGDRRPFDTTGAQVVTRGVWSRHGEVIVADACSSGLWLRLRPAGQTLHVTARWAPGRSSGLASILLRSRWHLLVRAVLLQYPALWWAGVHGSAPLHAGAFWLDGTGLLLAGPGGLGKSSLIVQAIAAGAVATSDNLVVSDGGCSHGVLEPLRYEGGTGRRMAYGRRESGWNGRATSVPTDVVLLLRRLVTSPSAWTTAGPPAAPSVRQAAPAAAERALVAGTLAAGELRRYWAFAGQLALATGLGPAAPAVDDVARRVAGRAVCLEATLPPRPPGAAAPDLRPLLDEVLVQARRLGSGGSDRVLLLPDARRPSEL